MSLILKRILNKVSLNSISDNMKNKETKNKKREILLYTTIVMSIVLVLVIVLLAIYLSHCGIQGKREGWAIKYFNVYHYSNGGKLDVGVTKVGNNVYYFEETNDKYRGKLFRNGYVLIGDNPYYFEKNGVGAKKGWIDEYYCLGDGALAVGWTSIDDKAYYFYTNGEVLGSPAGLQARNYTTTNGITIPESGYIDGEEGLAYSYAIKTLDDIGWNLKAAYRYSANFNYSGREERYDYKIHKAAIEGFENQSGNCLVWNATFCAMARILGYKANMIWGFITTPNISRVHSWTEIEEDGEIFVYDPRKSGGKGFRGFKVQYGEKGSYKYDESAKTYLDW